MKWLEVTVDCDGEAAEAVAEVLRPYGHGGVVIEQVGGPLGPDVEADGWDPGLAAAAAGAYRVRIYLPAPGEPGGETADESRRRISEALYHLNRLYPIPAPAFGEVSDEDWATAWKRHYSAFRVGRRFLICPAWLECEPEPGDHVLRLDPGMAFGTGLHPSTQLCLVALEDALRGGERVLDMGTGSGILAIAAARLGAVRIDAVDSDPVAIEAARANVELNGVAGALRLTAGTLGAGFLPDGPYELIVVNILARVIVALLGQGLAAPLAPGGTLIAAGIIAEQAAEVEDALARAGVAVQTRRAAGDWVALVGVKAEAR
jgi:ribosomal protein L11 methyltransferase